MKELDEASRRWEEAQLPHKKYTIYIRIIQIYNRLIQ